MDEEIRELLNEEIKSQIKDLSDMESGSKEKSEAIDDLCKLYRLHIEETKNEGELDEKQSQRFVDDNHFDDELYLKKRQLKEDVKDRWCRVGTAAAELVLPLIFYGTWMRKGFKFEQEGTFTSTTFRGLFSKFRPTK